MSSFAGYCNVCGKPVMHKTLFGTLHICLSPEERQAKYAMEAQLRQQQMNAKSSEFLRRLNNTAAGSPAHPNSEMEK